MQTTNHLELKRVQQGLQKVRLCCLMEAHDQCDGLVSGGVRDEIPCLCPCHSD